MSANNGAITYNYDPLGRLDTATSGTTTLEQNTYDGFDNITAHTQGTTTTTYTYDPLNRATSQKVGSGTPTQYSYLGLSDELTGETNTTSGLNKAYAYTPGGQRLFQYTPGTTATNPGYYTYNDHNDVEAVTGSTTATGGATTATYGYTAYGQPDPGQFTGNDKNNLNPGPATQPYNSYRFNAMRWDATSGQYDMGFRNYAPGLGQFLSRDMYDGALADMTLTTDPFTGNRYTFGAGNPVSNIELDGHTQCDAGYCPTQQQTQQVTERARQYGAGCPSTEPGCPGYQAPGSGNDGSQCSVIMRNCTNPCVLHPYLCPGWGTQLNEGTQPVERNPWKWNMFPGACGSELFRLSCPSLAATGEDGGSQPGGESGSSNKGSGSSSDDSGIAAALRAALEAAAKAAEERANAELARSIAGHAAEEHFGVTADEGTQIIEDVLNSPEKLTRPLNNGRTGYYNNGTIVIKNPRVTYGGTAYPGSFDDFLKLR